MKLALPNRSAHPNPCDVKHPDGRGRNGSTHRDAGQEARRRGAGAAQGRNRSGGEAARRGGQGRNGEGAHARTRKATRTGARRRAQARGKHVA